MAVITERDRERADEVLFGQMVDDVLFAAREQIARLVAAAREEGRQEIIGKCAALTEITDDHEWATTFVGVLANPETRIAKAAIGELFKRLAAAREEGFKAGWAEDYNGRASAQETGPR